MKYVLMICLSLAAVLVRAQTADDYEKDVAYKKFIERIAGQWSLDRIIDAEKANKGKEKADRRKSARTNDIEKDQGTNAMYKIEFSSDARYKMNNSQEAIDSGSYRLNEQHGILYLESDRDPEPSEWDITIKGNQLTLTGRGDAADSRFRYVYNKTREDRVK